MEYYVVEFWKAGTYRFSRIVDSEDEVKKLQEKFKNKWELKVWRG